MDINDTLDPFIDSTEFSELVNLLLCHGIRMSYTNLLQSIYEKVPDIAENSSSFRQIFVLYSFCSSLLQSDHLQHLEHSTYLSTLHDGIIGFCKSNPVVSYSMSKIGLLKFIGGLRYLLTKSILLNPKFTVHDIQRTVHSFFPILPLKPSNFKHWQNLAAILHINLDDDKDILREANDKNFKAVRYFTQKIDDLAVERSKSLLERNKWTSFMWNNLKSFYVEFVKVLNDSLPGDPVVEISRSSNEKLKILSSKIKNDSSEKNMISFLNHICDLYKESKFWSSDLILGILK